MSENDATEVAYKNGYKAGFNAGYKTAIKIKHSTVCPLCGKIMDETESGKQYCYDCAKLLEEK